VWAPVDPALYPSRGGQDQVQESELGWGLVQDQARVLVLDPVQAQVWVEA